MDWKRTRWWLLIALAGTLLLAGCLGDSAQPLEESEGEANDQGDGSAPSDGSSPAEDQTSRVDEEDGPDLETHRLDGTMTAEAWHIGASYLVDGTETSITFEVPPNATTILAELHWTGEAGHFNLNVFTPHFCPYSVVDEPIQDARCWTEYWATGESEDAYRAEGDAESPSSGELTLEVPEDEIATVPCDQESCEWRAYVEPMMAAEAQFDLRVTVVHEGQLPDGYSAFEDADQA